MSDDKSKTGPQDRSKINLSEDYEVKYWTEKFGITKEALTAAVKAAGSSADAVKNHLQHD